uniref:Uncharacterized protein n=1 Tax=Lotharella globosa TaxID=91324 RepID=A0A7S4DXG0_9EUKA|mmetsp:Transcript_20933/g.42192  ORF Transcript_20933/g.42192 Transcript_20933/m.42192 type:complete len:193 (+) Transcript_20933:52-630(+)
MALCLLLASVCAATWSPVQGNKLQAAFVKGVDSRNVNATKLLKIVPEPAVLSSNQPVAKDDSEGGEEEGPITLNGAVQSVAAPPVVPAMGGDSYLSGFVETRKSRSRQALNAMDLGNLNLVQRSYRIPETDDMPDTENAMDLGNLVPKKAGEGKEVKAQAQENAKKGNTEELNEDDENNSMDLGSLSRQPEN